MLEEISILPDIVRYYVKRLWVKITCGVEINNLDLELVSRSLYQNQKAFKCLKNKEAFYKVSLFKLVKLRLHLNNFLEI